MPTKRRRRGEGSIRRRSDGRWEGRLRFLDATTGLPKRESVYGETEQDVRRQLQEMQRRIDDGDSPRDEALALEHYLEYWLEHSVKVERKPSTYRSYSQAVARIKGTRLGRARMRELSPLVIQASLIPKNPTRSDALAIVVLRRALEKAVQWRLLNRNPAEGVSAPRITKREIHPLDQAQAKAFLAAACDDRHYPLYRLALDTGMREGELFALRTQDVDFERGVVRVRRTFEHNTRTTTPPKTKAAVRDLGIGTETLLTLETQIAVNHASGYRGPLLFPSEVGTELRISNLYRRSFSKITAAIGRPDLRFHDLRHTAATLWLQAGMNPKAVSERLGHASVRITLDLYGHALPAAHREIAGFLDGVLSSE